MTTDDYTPPAASVMRAAQNSTSALRLLLAQRILCSRSKRWMGFRWLGMAVIAIAAPVVSLIWPGLAVVAGAVAAGWAFLGRTTFLQLERKKVEQAAAVQEAFDQTVFGMPDSGRRSAMPSLEEQALLAGPESEIPTKANREKLLDWYPIKDSANRSVPVAICQRANASYSDRLLKTTSVFWLGIMVVWSVVLVVVSLIIPLTVPQFLLGIVLPLLPAFLDVWEHWRGMRRASKDRHDLVVAIEDKLRDSARELEAQDLLVWQSRLFDVRRNGPQVPDFVYKLKRRKNEEAMETAADQLGQ